MSHPSLTFDKNSLRSDLLDELTRLASCGFLSNLPQRQRRDAVHRALLEIEADHFSLKAWQEAALYICGIDTPFDTARQAREALLCATQPE